MPNPNLTSAKGVQEYTREAARSYTATNSFGGGRSGGGSGRGGVFDIAAERREEEERRAQVEADNKAFEDSLMSYGYNGVDPDNLQEFISNSAGRVSDSVNGLVDWVKGQIGDASISDRIEHMLYNAMHPKEMFENSIKTLSDAFLGSNSEISNTVGKAVDAMAASNKSSAGAVSSAVSGLSDTLGSSFEDYMRMVRETTAENNAWSAAEAQKNRDWQERMSNTAHQREMADLQAAGLNPALAVTGGSGASVGSGAVAQADTSNTRILAELAMQAMSTAQVSAAGLSRVASTNSNEGWFNKFVNSNIGQKALGTLASEGARQIVKWAFAP